MDLMEVASQMFIDRLGAAGQRLNSGTVQHALGALLGGADGNLDLGGLIAKLNGGGLAGLAQSWLGDGENAGISPSEILDLFGRAEIDKFASALNLDESTAAAGLAQVLPDLVDERSSGGNLLDSAGGAAGLLGAATKLFR